MYFCIPLARTTSIILPLVPIRPHGIFPTDFAIKTLYKCLNQTCCMPRPSRFPEPVVQIMKLVIMRFPSAFGYFLRHGLYGR